MRFISPIISDARGSLGGAVFARNPTGVYMRARTAPTQPRTPSQVNNRDQFTIASQAWRTLGSSLIQGWNAYAETLSRTNSLGVRYTPSGFQVFVEYTRNLQSIGITDLPTLPTATFNPPAYDFLGFGNISDGTNLTQVTAVNEPNWDSVYLNTAFQGTPVYTPTQNFIGRATWRNIANPFSYSGADMPLLDQYIAVFGSAGAIGNNIWSRVRYVDYPTGQAGPWQRGPFAGIS